MGNYEYSSISFVHDGQTSKFLVQDGVQFTIGEGLEGKRYWTEGGEIYCNGEVINGDEIDINVDELSILAGISELNNGETVDREGFEYVLSQKDINTLTKPVGLANERSVRKVIGDAATKLGSDKVLNRYTSSDECALQKGHADGTRIQTSNSESRTLSQAVFVDYNRKKSGKSIAKAIDKEYPDIEEAEEVIPEKKSFWNKITDFVSSLFS